MAKETRTEIWPAFNLKPYLKSIHWEKIDKIFCLFSYLLPNDPLHRLSIDIKFVLTATIIPETSFCNESFHFTLNICINK